MNWRRSPGVGVGAVGGSGVGDGVSGTSSVAAFDAPSGPEEVERFVWTEGLVGSWDRELSDIRLGKLTSLAELSGSLEGSWPGSSEASGSAEWSGSLGEGLRAGGAPKRLEEVARDGS